MRVLSRRVSTRSAIVAAACAVALPACAATSTASSTPTSAAAATAAAGTAVSAAGDSATGSETGSAAQSSPATAAGTSCGAAFSTAAKSHRSTRTSPLVAVRAGRHTCFDRLVLEFRGRVTGYQVRYVDVVRADGSGQAVPVAGRAALQVTVIAPAYDLNGKPTFVPKDRRRVVDVTGFAALRQVAWAGSFEGYTTLAVGVRRGLPFRVLVVAGPGAHTRIVVDIAQQR